MQTTQHRSKSLWNAVSRWNFLRSQGIFRCHSKSVHWTISVVSVTHNNLFAEFFQFVVHHFLLGIMIRRKIFSYVCWLSFFIGCCLRCYYLKNCSSSFTYLVFIVCPYSFVIKGIDAKSPAFCQKDYLCSTSLLTIISKQNLEREIYFEKWENFDVCPWVFPAFLFKTIWKWKFWV